MDFFALLHVKINEIHNNKNHPLKIRMVFLIDDN